MENNEIYIKVGAIGKILEPLARGGTQVWKEQVEYVYVGCVEGCTRLHLFESVVGKYPITVAERDFISGSVHFTGSADTQREQPKFKAVAPIPDYYTPVGIRSYKPAAYTRIFKS